MSSNVDYLDAGRSPTRDTEGERINSALPSGCRTQSSIGNPRQPILVRCASAQIYTRR